MTDEDYEFRLYAFDLIAKADAMYRELYGHFKAESDAKYQAEFGHDGPSLAGFPIQSPNPLNSANRTYVYWRYRFSEKYPEAPKPREALGRG